MFKKVKLFDAKWNCDFIRYVRSFQRCTILTQTLLSGFELLCKYADFNCYLCLHRPTKHRPLLFQNAQAALLNGAQRLQMRNLFDCLNVWHTDIAGNFFDLRVELRQLRPRFLNVVKHIQRRSRPKICALLF